MTIEYSKVDDNTIRMAETVASSTEVSYDSLLARKEAHGKMKADAIEYHDKCIAEIDAMLVEAVKFGLKTQTQIAAELEAAQIPD